MHPPRELDPLDQLTNAVRRAPNQKELWESVETLVAEKTAFLQELNRLNKTLIGIQNETIRIQAEKIRNLEQELKTFENDMLIIPKPKGIARHN